MRLSLSNQNVEVANDNASIFGTDSFGTSFAEVTESVQFFLHNPDSREVLPSWQEEDTGSET